MPQPKPVLVPYSQLRPTLKTGDLISFSGTAALDWMIRFAEGEPYTHVGMVIEDNGTLFFWDAPGGGKEFTDPYYLAPNGQSGKPHAGARVAALDDLIPYYMTVEVALYARQLTAPVTADQKAALMRFVSVADGTPFPGDWLKAPDGLNLLAGLGLSSYLGIHWKATIAGNFYCAHLVAESFMRMGMMAIAPNPSNSYSPADFNAAGLPLIGCALSPTVQVSYP